MAILRLRHYPDLILKPKAALVTQFGPEEQKLFDDMIETMHVEEGVGLAAPQIGVSQQIFVACPTITRGEEYVFVNPEIIEARGREQNPEGCLSLPGISGEISRARLVRFRALDRNGKPVEMEVKDFFARIIQHEIDHLNGLLLIDRVDFDKRQELLASYDRL